MKYAELVEAYEAIEATSKRLEMTGLLLDLLRKAPAKGIHQVVYLTQGQLAASFEGVELGLAEKLVIKGLAQASGSGEDRVTKLYKERGDLGEAAQELLGKRRQRTLIGGDGAPLTVGEVFEHFLRIAEAQGSGSQERKLQLLHEMLARASPKEARFLVRAVTGKLRLGVADMTILDALALMAAFPKDPRARPVSEMTEEERTEYQGAKAKLERAYNTSSDLGAVARAVRSSGLEGLRHLQLKPGVPVRPMLAERLSTAEEIVAKMGGPCAVEYKYDGLRLQAHITPKALRFFSRRLEDMTPQFPDVAEALRKAFKGERCIVEGEAVVVDAAGDLLPFSEVTHRRGRKHGLDEAVEKYPVAILLFDLLHLDGEDFTSKLLGERRAALEKAFKASDRVRFSDYKVVKTAAQLEKFFEEAVAEGGEGTLAKSLGPDSVYRAGARGWQWIKLKRDYRAELSDSLDLVVVGALMGRGRRAGWYGALLMAAYNEDDDAFETVCKLGTGFSDELLKELPKKLKKHQRAQRHARVRSAIEADVWFTPAEVLEVRGAELTLSPVHTAAFGRVREGAGIALRFPRFTGQWRADKAPENATTIAELLEMHQKQRRAPAVPGDQA
ncbi:MAG TPA: ATP-dependent DNA ligase [Candidatus Thermoplasmatota archaeon]|nr:ATP-dependent DNA ligase [Candidatus Thermoplasmatota archaeon]